MIRGLYHSAAGMMARYHKLVETSHNLANVSTTAYKADRRSFGTLLDNEMVQNGAAADQAQRMEDFENGHYVDFSQGALEQTGSRNHFALAGSGFFAVLDGETGQQYFTRDGRFQINENRELTNLQGQHLLDEDGQKIIVPRGEFHVDDAGRVLVDGQFTQRFMLADFSDRTLLRKEGDNLFSLEEETAMVRPEQTRVQQGYLENSNVDIIREMVDMIALQRHYETSSRALTAQDQGLNRLISTVPRG